MRKLWLVMIALAVFASVSSYAVAANYLSVAGGGIIVEQEQLNPFNPAGIQFTNNFVQLEIYNSNYATNVTNTTTIPQSDVMFVFPLVVNMKFNDLLAFRLSVFNPADTPIIPAMHGNTDRMGGNAKVINAFSLFALTWAMKLGNTAAFGVKYEPQFAGQGKWADENYILAYSKHKIEPGIIFNLGSLNFSVLADLNFVFLNWSVAATNATLITNTVTAKSPLEMAGLKAQISYPLNSKLLLAARVEGGLGLFGYDEKYIAPADTLTNDVGASAYYLNIFGALKYSPIQLVETYFDIGTKLYGHNVISNAIGSGTFGNATNTNAINQIAIPSISMGVKFNPGIFTISIGLAQDIIASSSPTTTAPPTSMNNGYELDNSSGASGPFNVSYQGNTVWTMKRYASAGVSMNLNPFIVEAILNISDTSFLAEEIRNPLDFLDRIFNSSTGIDMPVLFAGLRCSVLF